MTSMDVEWNAGHPDYPSENGCGFDETSSKYRCACGSCHVVDGVKIFLGIYVAASVAGFFAFYPYSLFAIILPIAFTTSTAQAIERQDPVRLWPFLIAQGLVVLSSIAGAITIIVLFAIFDKNLVDALIYYGINASNPFAFFSALTLIVLTLVIITIISIYSLIVTKNCQALYQAKQMIALEQEELSKKSSAVEQTPHQNEDRSKRSAQHPTPSTRIN